MYGNLPEVTMASATSKEKKVKKKIQETDQKDQSHSSTIEIPEVLQMGTETLKPQKTTNITTKDGKKKVVQYFQAPDSVKTANTPFTGQNPSQQGTTVVSRTPPQFFGPPQVSYDRRFFQPPKFSAPRVPQIQTPIKPPNVNNTIAQLPQQNFVPPRIPAMATTPLQPQQIATKPQNFIPPMNQNPNPNTAFVPPKTGISNATVTPIQQVQPKNIAAQGPQNVVDLAPKNQPIISPQNKFESNLNSPSTNKHFIAQGTKDAIAPIANEIPISPQTKLNMEGEGENLQVSLSNHNLPVTTAELPKSKPISQNTAAAIESKPIPATTESNQQFTPSGEGISQAKSSGGESKQVPSSKQEPLETTTALPSNEKHPTPESSPISENLASAIGTEATTDTIESNQQSATASEGTPEVDENVSTSNEKLDSPAPITTSSGEDTEVEGEVNELENPSSNQAISETTSELPPDVEEPNPESLPISENEATAIESESPAAVTESNEESAASVEEESEVDEIDSSTTDGEDSPYPSPIINSLEGEPLDAEENDADNSLSSSEQQTGESDLEHSTEDESKSENSSPGANESPQDISNSTAKEETSTNSMKESSLANNTSTTLDEGSSNLKGANGTLSDNNSTQDIFHNLNGTNITHTYNIANDSEAVYPDILSNNTPIIGDMDTFMDSFSTTQWGDNSSMMDGMDHDINFEAHLEAPEAVYHWVQADAAMDVEDEAPVVQDKVNESEICPPANMDAIEDYHAPSGEDEAIYEIYYSNPIKTCGNIVEIGAGDGVQLSKSLFFEQALNWNSLLIEANPNSYNALQHNRKKAKTVHGGFCSGKKLEFYDGSYRGEEGLDEVISEKRGEAEFPSESSSIADVPCLNLIEVFKNQGISKIDIMYIAVSGDVLSVISKMDWNVKVDIWVIELDGNEDRNDKARSILNDNDYVKAEWDIKRWCSNDMKGHCMPNEVFLAKGYNPLPKDVSRRLTEVQHRRRLRSMESPIRGHLRH